MFQPTYSALGQRIGDASDNPGDALRRQSYAEQLAKSLQKPVSVRDQFKKQDPVRSADFV